MLYIIYYITYYIFLSMCLNGSLIWKGLSKKHYKIPNASQQITSSKLSHHIPQLKKHQNTKPLMSALSITFEFRT